MKKLPAWLIGGILGIMYFLIVLIWNMTINTENMPVNVINYFLIPKAAQLLTFFVGYIDDSPFLEQIIYSAIIIFNFIVGALVGWAAGNIVRWMTRKS